MAKTTGAKPKDLLAKFRKDYMPRIAVTVDLIATGTDVKAIECLLFMRNIESAAYFEQMKGRGVRVISADDLNARTPDAAGKDRFVIVDAVGVCERDETHSKPLDRKPTVPLEKLLQMAAQGVAGADLASSLGARLAPTNDAQAPHARRYRHPDPRSRPSHARRFSRRARQP
jgi:type I restriction enzyme R subunit